MMRSVFALVVLCLPAIAIAQDSPPQRIDLITANHVVGMVSIAPSSTNYAVAWFNSGFGRIDLPGQKVIAPIEIDKQYVWFKITNPSNGSMDDNWITPIAAWDAFIVSNNVAALRSASYQFNFFTQSSSYVTPVISEPTTWEQRTAHLYVGYTSTNTIMVVKKNDTTLQWEWSIRGTRGVSAWTSAATVDAAKAAAQLATQ